MAEHANKTETKLPVIYNENGKRELTTAPNTSANSEPEINYLDMTTDELFDYVKALGPEDRRDMMHFVIVNLPTKEFVDFCLGVEGGREILAGAAKMAKENREKELVDGAKIAAEIDCVKDSIKKSVGDVERAASGDGEKIGYSGGWLKLL